jgi:hypothetical protein
MSIDQYDPQQAPASVFFRGKSLPREDHGPVALSRLKVPAPGPASGSAGTDLLIGFCLLIGAGLVAAMVFLGSPGGGPAHAPGPAEAPQVETPFTAPPDSMGDLTPISNGGIEVGAPADWRQYEKTFDGTCTISGMIVVDPGVEFPSRWRLVILPSRLSIGRERAAERIVEFEGNERTFEEFDLPMGGYRVHVEAQGMSCRGQEVMLFKLKDFEHLPGKNHAHLLLKLIPAGIAEGIVRDTDGVGVANLPVFIENQRDRGRQSTHTDGSGYWRIDEVIEDPYHLSLGNIDRPLIEVQSFGMVGARYTHPDQTIPLTRAITVRVVDEVGAPVAKARLRGYGRPAGVIEASSDVDGTARILFLPDGEYTLRGEARGGLRGVTAFQVSGDSPGRAVTLRLTRRR